MEGPHAGGIGPVNENGADSEFSRGNEWPDFGSFKADLDSYVRHWNARKRQGALGGLTPEEFRKSFGAAA